MTIRPIRPKSRSSRLDNSVATEPPTEASVSPELITLNKMIDQAFDHKSWHGTNLKGSIKGITAREAAWRPNRERHNIWEIVVHSAYWKYAVVRRLLSEKRGSFPIKGSNWFVRPSAGMSEAEWKTDLRLLLDLHAKLKRVISELTSKDLALIAPGSKVRNVDLLTGIAAHDLYHAGQIQLLKRLHSSSGKLPV
ncbi:MAG: hypothetical protein DMG19_00735 [Acidobacteria bacterium]|nr:MAG: hypothetical protein DMG19_00735 [Acidobacteriota bacterium]